MFKKCLNCGKEFKIKLSNKKQKFCCNQCRIISSKTGLTYEQRKCKNCGKMFKVVPSRPQFFCCRQCGFDFNKGTTYTKRICPNCKKEFKVEPWKTKEFCSFQCGVDYNKGATFEEKRCLYCKKLFKAEPWKHQKFCSFECGIEYKRGKPGRVPRQAKSAGKSKKSRPQQTLRNGQKVYVHRLLIEEEIGRHLILEEQVHHIDLNSSNNEIDNLWLYENAREHMKGHHSMQKLIPALMKKGIVSFKEGKYVLSRSWQGS